MCMGGMAMPQMGAGSQSGLGWGGPSYVSSPDPASQPVPLPPERPADASKVADDYGVHT